MNPPRTEEQLLEANRRFYDKLWSGARLVDPRRFNTWPVVEGLLSDDQRRLEVGPGLRPRLPVESTVFIDISPPALRALEAHGGIARMAPIAALPFEDRSFDLICALDIIEHVDDDVGAIKELSRVGTDNATYLLSTPLHPEYWTTFDEIVGHRRRYPPQDLVELLGDHGLMIEHSAVFGMKPQSSPLLSLGMWFLKHHHRMAMRWYNRVFMPIALRRQRPLQMTAGLVPTEGVDEVFLVCRKVS